MDINLNSVSRVYSGKPGCMCGCRGKYSESSRSKAIVFNKITQGNYKVDTDANCVFLETGTRILVAFFD